MNINFFGSLNYNALKDRFRKLKDEALKVIRQATGPYGIMALPSKGTDVENYTRIWARDAVMAGLVGIEYEDSILISGLKNSLNTLRNHQSTHGIIPSNVSIGENPTVSYGGTAGRVDATLWYIIGTIKYIEYSKDDFFKKTHSWSLEKALEVTQIWEFNYKDLMYTPLSGNWADEYPIHGYTLYDNCLRLWGLELYVKTIGDRTAIKEKAENVRNSIQANFFFKKENGIAKYHNELYNRELQKEVKPYFLAGFNPSRYYPMFDAAGNGLALMLGLLESDYETAYIEYIRSVFQEVNIDLLPAFWPVIDAQNDLYGELTSNYAYSFKNDPHQFHNGGIWPIMNGWMAKGLSQYGQTEVIERMQMAYCEVEEKEAFKFSEYISSDTLEPKGKAPLCYSASGALMILKA